MTTLKTRIAEVRALDEKLKSGTPILMNGARRELADKSPTMLTIINELSDKLDIARKALRYCQNEVYTPMGEDEVASVRRKCEQALKLTDIGE